MWRLISIRSARSPERATELATAPLPNAIDWRSASVQSSSSAARITSSNGASKACSFLYRAQFGATVASRFSIKVNIGPISNVCPVPNRESANYFRLFFCECGLLVISHLQARVAFLGVKHACSMEQCLGAAVRQPQWRLLLARTVVGFSKIRCRYSLTERL
jgi:hypothetical protein